MHDIVIFSLIVVALLRIAGIIISLDFYIDSRNKRYKVLILGWFLWLSGGLIPLFSFNISDPQLYGFLLLYNALISTLGLLALGYGLNLSYLAMKGRYLLIYIIVLFLFSNILYFIFSYQMAISFTSLLSQLMWIFFIALPIIKWKKFSKRVDKQLWYNFFSVFVLGLSYIPISIIAAIQGYSFGLYNSNDGILIGFNYGYLLTITVLLHILTVHLEYRTTQSEKRDLKDKYSHNLGNALQSIYTALELAENYELNEQDENMIRETSQGKIKEAAELLQEIRDL